MDPQCRTLPTDGRSSTFAIRAGLGLAMVTAAALAVLIGRGGVPEAAAYDQLIYHEPAIRIFIRDWPRVDLTDYLSATTPGYHLTLAATAQVLGDAPATLQAVGATFTVLLAGILGWGLALRAGWLGVALAGMVLCSMYVVRAGGWVLPDNAGWLGVVASVVLALQRPTSRGAWVRLVLLLGLVAAATALVRQVHVWTAGLAFAVAWLGPRGPSDADASPRAACQWLFWDSDAARGERLGRAALGLAAMLPAALVVLAFYRMWGNNLVPPTFIGQYSGKNFAAPAYVLAIVGVAATFLLPIALAGWREAQPREMVRRLAPWACVGGVVGVVLALIAPTTYDYDAGRRSGLWNVAGRLSAMDVAGYASPIIVLASAWGGVMASLLLRRVAWRDRIVLVSAGLGFASAMAAGPEVWQRYVEPFALAWSALLAACAARSGGGDSGRPSRWAVCGPMILAGLLSAQSVRSLGEMRAWEQGRPEIDSPDRAHLRTAPVYGYWERHGVLEPPRRMQDLRVGALEGSSGTKPGTGPNPRVPSAE